MLKKLKIFYKMMKFRMQAAKIVAEHTREYEGVYYMKGGWSPIRNALESVGSLAGNYFLPGSSIVTDQLVSKGAQKELSSPLGIAAQLGTGLAGSGVGSSFTGIPESAGGVAEGNLLSGAQDYISNALGISGGGATGAANPAITSQFQDLGGATGSVGTSAAPTAGTGGVAGGDFGSSLGNDFNLPGGSPGASAGAAAGATPAVPIPSGGFLSPASGTAINQAVGGTGSSAGSSGIMSTITNALKGASGGLGTLGQVASLGGVAKNLLAPSPKGTNELLTAGGNALNTEQQLINSEATGKIPPGQQAQIDQQVRDAQNTIRSKFASMGLSGSDQERQALQAAADQGVSQTTNAATQATQTGLNALGATNSIYSTILNSILGNNNNLSSAISTLGGVAKPASGVVSINGQQGNIQV